MTEDERTPVAMTIATSDSGGGAGIQADLKAFARCGVHGTSAIVALTAQNTHEVVSVETLPRQFILDQVRAVASDIGVDAVKIGMLFDEGVIDAVSEALDLVGGAPVVIDPVMVAESGARLLDEDAQAALVELVVARATVVTPNLPEARVLAGDAALEGEALARAVHALGPRAVVEDIGVDAVKVGMLGSVASARAVAQAFDLLAEGTPIVVDPVMVAESGGRLLEDDAQSALVELVVSRATVVTPNLPEARVLAGDDALDGEALARAVHALGPGAVVVTGGHREQAIDMVFDGERVIELAGPRYPDGAAHGSGCTHSSTLAARLALGDDLEAAAREAKRVASEAVRDGLRDIGAGAGPVDVLGLGRAR